MKIGIVGFSNSGKTTVFNALTGQGIETTIYPTTGGEPHLGTINVPDGRLERLASIYAPRKPVHATVSYIDYIGFTRGDTAQNSKVYEFIRDSDALLLVVRAFEDPAVAHPFGVVDPERDLRALAIELILGDLGLVETRLEKIEGLLRKGKKEPGSEAERAALIKCKKALEEETPLRSIRLEENDLRAVRHLGFLSLKPVAVVFNIHEEALKNKAETGGLVQKATGLGYAEAVALSGRIEMELAQLPEGEREAFLGELGIEEPAMPRLIRLCYRMLNLISFFTIGKNEVRAWSVERDTPAPRAAGKVHTDMERGFIRAEVIGFDDFLKAGDMAEARGMGLLRLEGKHYIVRDGDIINFRFNV